MALAQSRQRDQRSLSVWWNSPHYPARIDNKDSPHSKWVKEQRKGKPSIRRIIVNYQLEKTRKQNSKELNKILTSTTEFVSILFLTRISRTTFAPEGRHKTCSLCLISNGIAGTEKLHLNVFDMLMTSSSSKLPWQRPSTYSCRIRAMSNWPNQSCHGLNI